MNSTKIIFGMDPKGTLRGSDRGSLVAGSTEGESTVNSPKRLARIAGVLYLLNAITAGFAYGFVEIKMYVPGNAATTAGNVVANSGLVRLGVVADLFQATVWVFLAMTLSLLLKHVNKSAASAMVLLLLDTQHYGILIVQIFYGLWLVPLGYLAYKSAGWFPRWLGVLLIVGGVCYLVDLLALFLVPDFGQNIHLFVGVIPTTIAEVSMVIYLLVIGVKTSRQENRILVEE